MKGKKVGRRREKGEKDWKRDEKKEKEGEVRKRG